MPVSKSKSKCRETKKYKTCISRSLRRSRNHNKAKKSCDAKLCKVSSSLSELNKCKKTAKYERCVMAIKQKNKIYSPSYSSRSPAKYVYNPWAICNVSVCNYRSKSRHRSR